jgi:hypothetical protein
MIDWQKAIEKRNAEKYPGLTRAALRPCDDLKDKAFNEATAIINANPNVKLIMAICSPAVPGAAEAVKQAGKTGQVKVIGLGCPTPKNRRYVKEGVTERHPVEGAGFGLPDHSCRQIRGGRETQTGRNLLPRRSSRLRGDSGRQHSSRQTLHL